VNAARGTGPWAGDTAPALACLLSDPNMENERVSEALAQLGKAAVSQVVPLAVQAEDGPLRLRAVRTLGRIGPDAADAVPALLGILAEKLPEEDPPNVRINELVSIADGEFPDEDGDASDWVEFYNQKKEPVNLEGWTFTNDITDPGKWTFPAVDLDPDGYIVVFASGKNRTPLDTRRLHTNFELDDKGGCVVLFDPSGTLVSEMEFPEGVRGWSWICVDEKPLREICAKALGCIGPAALPQLTALLRDTAAEPEVRAMAAQAVGRMREGGRAALPDLLGAMKCAEARVRVEAVAAVGLLADDAWETFPEAVPALVAASQQEDVMVRDTALAALCELDQKQCREAPKSEWAEHFRDLWRDRGWN
jgi:HEAT repeat protein